MLAVSAGGFFPAWPQRKGEKLVHIYLEICVYIHIHVYIFADYFKDFVSPGSTGRLLALVGELPSDSIIKEAEAGAQIQELRGSRVVNMEILAVGSCCKKQ